MKKFILFALAAATMLIAGSCQKEKGLKDGDASEVTFSIDLPVDLSTKAIGDGTTATELYYGVFNQKGEYIQSLAQTAALPVVGKTATLNLKLVRNYTYSIVFWAQAPGAPYSFDPETGEVTVDYAGDANDETRDAFCKLHTFTVPDQATFDETVVLKRPFAQINFGASDFAQIDELGLDMESTVVISGLADSYNILEGTISGDATTALELNTVPAQFDPAESLYVNGKEYGYVSMNYVLAPQEAKELANVHATFSYNGSSVDLDVPNVPFQRNYRTNIIGTFFTDEVTFTIVVDEEFYQPDYNVVTVATAAQLQEAAAEGGMVTLASDITISNHLNVTNDLILDFNGCTLTVDVQKGVGDDAIWVRSGNVVLTGNGTIQFINTAPETVYASAVFATGTANLTIENGTYIGAAEAVFAQANAQVVINGGSFKSTEYPAFTLNLKDTARNTASILVNGGSFYQFNPADNKAEGEGTNFVAAGKTVEQDGEWYVVK